MRSKSAPKINSLVMTSHFSLIYDGYPEDIEREELLVRIISIDHRVEMCPWKDRMSKGILELKVLNCIQNWHGEKDVKIVSMKTTKGLSDYCDIQAWVFDDDAGDENEGDYIERCFSLHPVTVV